MPIPEGIVCRGCWQLGNCCGECSRCLENTKDAVMTIRDLHSEVARLRRLVSTHDDNSREIAKLRICLTKVFHTQGTHRGKQVVADALGRTVEQLETGS